METVHRRTGTSKVLLPELTEQFGLAVGAAMNWSRLRDSSSPMFFVHIATEVKRCGSTLRQWDKKTMTHFVHEVLFNGIPQAGMTRFLQRKFMGASSEERGQLKRDFISNVIYMFLGRCDAGVEYRSALALAQRSCVDKVLKCVELGGSPDWELTNFLRDIWADVGEQAGLKLLGKEFITMIVAGAQEGRPVKYLCETCNQPILTHKGDRLHLVSVQCRCQLEEVEHVPEPRTKQARGMHQLDVSGACGINTTYNDKITHLQEKYGTAPVKDIIQKLVGVGCVGMTGEQGGKTLACLLYATAEDAATRDESQTFLFKDGAPAVEVWLKKKLQDYNAFPIQKSLFEEAIKFYPKLVAGMAAYESMRNVPSVNFDSDDDVEEPGPSAAPVVPPVDF